MTKKIVRCNSEDSSYEQGRNNGAFGYREGTINGHGTRSAILYARVSTEEQARSGFSLA
jgi:hypothetical protein